MLTFSSKEFDHGLFESAGNMSIAVAAFDVQFIVGKLKERPADRRTREVNIAEKFQHSW